MAPKFPGKKFNFAFLVFLGLVCILGLLFSANSSLPSKSPVLTPTPAISLAPIPDFAAGWQIYTNRQYGYSVRYPQKWKLDETRPQPPDLIVKVSSPRWEHYYPWGLSVNLTVDSADSAKKYFENLQLRREPLASDNEIEKVNLAGVSCLKLTSKLPKTGGFGPEILCLRNNYLYKIQIFVYSPSAEEKKLGDEILLTFRFLN